MRCRACDKRLTDKESTRKYANAPTVFIDLCNHCFATIADEVPDLEGEAVADFDDDDVNDALEEWDYQQSRGSNVDDD